LDALSGDFVVIGGDRNPVISGVKPRNSPAIQSLYLEERNRIENILD
jgi:hypothetical protein